jgi:hypothetical protein
MVRDRGSKGMDGCPLTETISNLMEQGGVGNPNDMDTRYEVVDLSPFIIMFHGDLGMGDWIYSILQRRAIEKTAWNRFQFAVVVTDLFGLVRERVKAFTRIECKFCIGGGCSFDQLTVRW